MNGSARRMIRRGLALVVLTGTAALLAGCLFTMNHPQVTADGTVALFLSTDGVYMLFPETDVLHLLRDGEWVAVPGATLHGAGGLMDLSPDDAEALYVDVRPGEFLDPLRSTLYRVALGSDAVPEPILETEDAIMKAVWVEEDRILLLRFGDGEATLESLEPATGRTEELARGLLSFDVPPGRAEVLLLTVDRNGEPSIGSVVRWDLVTDRRETLAIVVLSEATVEAFAMMPGDVLWDVSPDGAWVALSLYDATVIEPTVEVEVPSLYLIDVEAGSAERIAGEGILPGFRPDGTGLVYLTATEDENPVAMLRDLLSGETAEIPQTEGVSSVCWLSPTILGLTFEADADRHRLVELDLTTGQTRELVGPVTEASD